MAQRSASGLGMAGSRPAAAQRGGPLRSWHGMRPLSPWSAWRAARRRQAHPRLHRARRRHRAARPPPRLGSTLSKLESALKPVRLDIIDESYKHAGHAGNPSGSPDAETHFK